MTGPAPVDSGRSLAGFSGRGYDKGRGVLWQASWQLVSSTMFCPWWVPASVRVAILRAFGAQIGQGVLVRHRVRVHWPWKLAIGDDSWIGEGAWILNLEPVKIGRDVCISQEALLCTGSHDRCSPTFEFDNAPIIVEDGAWVAARAVVLRGVVIGSSAMVGAGAVVRSDVAPDAMVGSPGPSGPRRGGGD
jgi:putative colanic acid biosynthesis acetyltransferase WcaF